jgi:murein L,D-transpeptidase YcbB/YkuD
LRIRQQPGPANSLGLLKFVFPNNFGVYMHGTPEHSLFFQPRRDFSHGCIRIQDPPALAAWVLRDRPEWTEARISAAMSGKQSISVRLSAPIPVLILYGTVFVEENGEVHFFQDIYGHDATLKKVLAAGRH